MYNVKGARSLEVHMHPVISRLSMHMACMQAEAEAEIADLCYSESLPEATTCTTSTNAGRQVRLVCYR